MKASFLHIRQNKNDIIHKGKARQNWKNKRLQILCSYVELSFFGVNRERLHFFFGLEIIIVNSKLKFAKKLYHEKKT